VSQTTKPDLADRVDELRAWARSRINQCLADEQHFGEELRAIAAQERRTLLAVLRILDARMEEETNTCGVDGCVLWKADDTLDDESKERRS
jgi:hypothetical protein